MEIEPFIKSVKNGWNYEDILVNFQEHIIKITESSITKSHPGVLFCCIKVFTLFKRKSHRINNKTLKEGELTLYEISWIQSTILHWFNLILNVEKW